MSNNPRPRIAVIGRSWLAAEVLRRVKDLRAREKLSSSKAPPHGRTREAQTARFAAVGGDRHVVVA